MSTWTEWRNWKETRHRTCGGEVSVWQSTWEHFQCGGCGQLWKKNVLDTMSDKDRALRFEVVAPANTERYVLEEVVEGKLRFTRVRKL